MAVQRQIGWWMDRDTCIGCDRRAYELKYVNYIDMRPSVILREKPHGHNLMVMLCDACSNLFCAPDSPIQERMYARLDAWLEHCKCHTFFETQSNTPIAMMHSRS